MRKLLTAIAILTLTLSSAAWADYKVWWGNTGGSVGDWATAANWEPSGVPGAGDRVFVRAGSAVISAGLNQSAVALGDVIIEEGYTGDVGTYTGATPTYLQIDCTAFRSAGTGTIYVELAHTGAIDATIEDSDTGADAGVYGHYITTDGTGTIGTLTVKAGKVALGAFGDDPDQTAAVVRVAGSTAVVLVGQPVTATAVHVDAGTARLMSQYTIGTLEVSGGVVAIFDVAPITAATILGGIVNHSGTGTVVTATVDGGVLDCTVGGNSRTITNLNLLSGTFSADPDTTTITTINDRTDTPYTITVSKK